MPMNRLLFDHQLAKIKSAASQDAGQRAANDVETARAAKDIRDWRRENGLPLTGWPDQDGGFKPAEDTP